MSLRYVNASFFCGSGVVGAASPFGDNARPRHYDHGYWPRDAIGALL